MPITTTENETSVVAASTTPSIPFRDSGGSNIQITASSDLVVTHTDSSDVSTVLTETTHYTVTLVASDELYTATVDILGAAGVAVNDTIHIARSTPYTQASTYTEGAELPAKTLQANLDKAVILAQQLLNKLGHSVRLREADGALDELTAEASTVFGLNASKELTLYDDGELLTLLGITTGGGSLLGVKAFADDSARAAAVPEYDGQPGFQVDKLNNGAQAHNAFYISYGTSAGEWQKYDNRGKGADIASASALTLGTDGDYFDVTGTTTIASISTWNSGRNLGRPFRLHFDGALTLTHHSTNLVLPSGANITTAAGDEASFIEYEAAKFRCTSYTKASGEALVGSGGGSKTRTLLINPRDFSTGYSAGAPSITTLEPSGTGWAGTALSFDDGTSADEEIFYHFVMPEDWDQTTYDVKPKLYWLSQTETGGGVHWEVSIDDGVADGSDISAAVTWRTASATPATGSSPWDLNITTFSSITTSTASPGNLILLRLKRVGSDSGDTMANDAEVLLLVLEFDES